MENTKYGKRREGRWTPIRAKAQDTRANPNSWETHLVRKRWDIGLLRALSLQIMMMMMMTGYMLNVLHWLPVRQRIQYRVASLVWRCQLGLAPAYLMDLCRPVSSLLGARSSRSLRSAERGVLVVPFAPAAALQNCAFSVAGTRVRNDLPQELRLFPRL